MKTELEIGDEIVRFEVGKKIECLYVINEMTKTLAKPKDKCKSFKKDLIFNTTLPSQITYESKENIIAEVCIKGKQTWSSPRFYLIKKGTFNLIKNK